MSAPADKFAPRSPDQLMQLIREHPLAWIVSRDGAGFSATPLPLRPLTVVAGRVERLAGHFARSNPQVNALQRDGRALILFMGPQGYISPSWICDRTWAPTWNYATAQFLVDIEFDEDPAKLDALLEDLVGAMEHGRPRAWHPAEMGERYAKLKSHIIRFEAHVLAQRLKFKLGQDERDSVFRDITVGLRENGADELLRWMRQLNPERSDKP